MPVKRFFITWLLASALMLGLSYVWHGVVLTDFNNVENVGLPLPYFFALLTLVYLVIGALLTFVLSLLVQTKKATFKGLLTGAALGFFIYLIAFVLGVSFKSGDIKHLVVDFGWQMFEQGVGGVVIAGIFAIGRKRDEFLFEEA